MSDAAHDIEAQQRIDRRQVRDDAEVFESLIKHPGWPRFLAMIEKVGANYHATVMRPLENTFEAVKPEFAKGALTGLSLAAQLPSAKIREAAELKKQSTDEEE